MSQYFGPIDHDHRVCVRWQGSGRLCTYIWKCCASNIGDAHLPRHTQRRISPVRRRLFGTPPPSCDRYCPTSPSDTTAGCPKYYPCKPPYTPAPSESIPAKQYRCAPSRSAIRKPKPPSPPQTPSQNANRDCGIMLRTSSHAEATG